MLMALLRSAAGQVSLTSTAPEAHSPPMPMPSTARQNSSCMTLCDVAAPSDAREKSRIVAHQRPRPAEAIGDVTENRAADARHDQGHGAEHAGRVVPEPEVHPELPNRHGVEHEVHGVEHPAELRGEQHAPLLARDGAIPRHAVGGGYGARPRWRNWMTSRLLPWLRRCWQSPQARGAYSRARWCGQAADDATIRGSIKQQPGHAPGRRLEWPLTWAPRRRISP